MPGGWYYHPAACANCGCNRTRGTSGEFGASGSRQVVAVRAARQPMCHVRRPLAHGEHRDPSWK
eukprot:5795025-Pleurochrysis_carterae.AAC.1